MDKIKIEHNVPMPSRANRSGVADIFRQMNIGDSVVLPASQRNNFYSTARLCGKRVAIRSINSTTVRVWVIGDHNV